MRRCCAASSQCNSIHKSIVEQFKHAIVYGKSVKHQPQRVGLTHELADEDISESRRTGPWFSLPAAARRSSAFAC